MRQAAPPFVPFMRRGFFSVVAVVALFVGACDVSDRSDRNDSADEEARHAPESPADSGRLEVVERYLVPRPEDDTTHATISALAVRSDGRVHVATDDGYLHDFNVDALIEGSTRLFGSLGSGGLVIRSLLVGPDGNLIARDSTGAIHTLRVEGLRPSVTTVGPILGLRSSQLLALGSGGDLLVGLSPTLAHRASPSSSGRPLLAHLDRRGRLRDTLRVAGPLIEGCAGPDDHFHSGSLADLRTRYLPSVQWAPLPSGGAVVGCNAGYRLVLLDDQGRTEAVITHENPSVPVTSEEHQSFIAAWTLRMRNSQAGADWTWRGDSLPGQKPAYSSVLAGSDGRIWVWPSQPSRPVPAPPQWVFLGGPQTLWVEPSTGAFDVFADDGSFLGSVSLPGGGEYAPFGVLPSPVIRGDTLWMAASDSIGAGSVVRAHVRWASEEATE